MYKWDGICKENKYGRIVKKTHLNIDTEKSFLELKFLA